ncbi:CGI-121-domain-containing protein [Leucosporidium creatinivorum]|uniref:EKC/KEOPS complex subunit CGI121 n=1 Tax=Leucosporidium creatinivorum TaxID=106004 RepID=A0A1Y2G270_9BASI|nr:CGI-121-domain-containing protein [Leucosporidium creatinivorum]
MESFALPHHGVTVHLGLFSPISNASALRTRLVAASTLPADDEGEAERAKLDFAFVDAAMLTSRLHLLTAVQQALLAQADDALKTKTVHSEVLFQLEPGTNITESLKHFGLGPTTKSLALVHIAPLTSVDDSSSAEAILSRMKDLVQLEPSSLDLLGQLPDGGTNEKSLRKYYKLNTDIVLTSQPAGSPQARQALDQLCIGAVALKVAA